MWLWLGTQVSGCFLELGVAGAFTKNGSQLLDSCLKCFIYFKNWFLLTYVFVKIEIWTEQKGDKNHDLNILLLYIASIYSLKL